MVAFVMVTAVFAQTWPVSVRAVRSLAEPVRVMSPPPRMVPWNGALTGLLTVSVASAPTHQNTLHGVPPSAITTLRLVVVKPAPITKFQGPLLVRLRVWSVNVNAAPVQQVPVPRFVDAAGKWGTTGA